MGLSNRARALIALVALAFAAWVVYRRLHVATDPAQTSSAAPSASARAGRVPRVPVTARKHASVSGRVVDESQKPVEGASVCAWASRGTGLITRETDVPRCAKADATGAYSLSDLFPVTPLTLSATAPGHPPERFHGPGGDDEVRLNDGETRTGVDFVLRGGGVLVHGSVADVTGGVVAGALVVTTGDDVAGRAMVTSDAKGEFQLWVQPGEVRLAATAVGYAPSSTVGPAPGHFFAIHLVPGSTLIGRVVVAGSGAPAPGVYIEAIQVEGGSVRASTRSEDDGRFKIDSLLPGRYRIEATSDSYEGYSRSSITLGMGETSQELVVELDPAYVVRGRVVEKGTLDPCKSGTVRITDPKQSEYSEALIDPDGSVRMASVIPGKYRVEVSCKDHVDRDDYPMIDVVDRDAPPLTWEVEKGASVRVSVVDPKGQPVPRASVRAMPTNDPRRLGAATDKAEADGTYLVTGLKDGHYDVVAKTQDGENGEAEATVAVGREERVKIELAASGVIDGVVEDKDHKPVPNINVYASGPTHSTARSLDDGTFSITGLPSGEYDVDAFDSFMFRTHDSDGEHKHVTVNVKAPEHVKVKVSIDNRHASIEGHVVDRSGQPVTDAFVDYAVTVPGMRGVPWTMSRGRAPVVTDTEGKFKIDGLAEGDYNVRAYRKGGGEAHADAVKTGTHDLAMRIDDGGSISGTLSAKGAPVERFNVRVSAKSIRFYRYEMFFHAQGVFFVRDLPAGEYDVMADTPQGTASTTVTLADGEQKTGVALQLTLRGVVEGRLVDLDHGTPVAGMELEVEGESTAAVMTGETLLANKSGEDGRFHLEGVLPGSWQLLVSGGIGDTFGGLSVPIEVKEGGGISDVGTIRVPKPRIGPGDKPGDLGLRVNAFGEAHEQGPLTVIGVSGAAEEAGVKVGDIVVSVDGYDVTGNQRSLYMPLTTVASGRKVEVGFQGGAKVTLVARSILDDE